MEEIKTVLLSPNNATPPLMIKVRDIQRMGFVYDLPSAYHLLHKIVHKSMKTVLRT